MCVGTRLYPLPGGDGDGTKVWYPLGLGIGMRINFFYGDEYGIAKLMPAPLRCHPYMESNALVKAMVEFSSKALILGRRVGSLY